MPKKHIQSVCFECSPEHLKPGGLIRIDKEGNCASCGKDVILEIWPSGQTSTSHIIESQKRWDRYFHRICVAIASKSPCLSRQIGAILIKDKSIVSTGYNGPARGYPHCEPTALPRKDMQQKNKLSGCPRHAKGYASGEGLHECPAAHAEGNCVANAARIGASTIGTTLYMNCIIPCKDCAILLVNAGIAEVVVDDVTPYHEMSIEILKAGYISVRTFA